MIVAELHRLDWEEKIFGIPCFKLIFTGKGSSVETIVSKLNREFVSFFISTRIEADKLNIAHYLEENKFKLVENYLELKHDLKQLCKIDSHSAIYEQPNRKNATKLAEIAYESLTNSRFHLDYRLNKSLASRTRYEWVLNGCSGRADHIFYHTEGEEPSGFLLSKTKYISKCKVAVLDLIAVGSNHRRKGIGKKLIDSFLVKAYDEKHDYALVGTQSVNISAINLYQKLGFMLNKSSYSFHYLK